MNNADRPAAPLFNDHGSAMNGNRGLSKREHFAAMAMQGLVSKHGVGVTTDSMREIMEASWAMADIMLEDEG